MKKTNNLDLFVNFANDVSGRGKLGQDFMSRSWFNLSKKKRTKGIEHYFGRDKSQYIKIYGSEKTGIANIFDNDVLIYLITQLRAKLDGRTKVGENEILNAGILEFSGYDYLLFVDDDNPVPPDALEKLIEADKDIVVAAILSRNPNAEGVHTLCAFYSETHDILGEPLRAYQHITSFRDEGPLHKIDAGGTGCMLIKRHVLEKMNIKFTGAFFEFGDIIVNGQRRTMSEDVEFCERAGDIGFEVWLHEDVRPVHLGSPIAIQYKP